MSPILNFSFLVAFVVKDSMAISATDVALTHLFEEYIRGVTVVYPVGNREAFLRTITVVKIEARGVVFSAVFATQISFELGKPGNHLVFLALACFPTGGCVGRGVLRSPLQFALSVLSVLLPCLRVQRLTITLSIFLVVLSARFGIFPSRGGYLLL
jgi:hypothetical protein